MDLAFVQGEKLSKGTCVESDTFIKARYSEKL
jgi:hypothetical protein